MADSCSLSEKGKEIVSDLKARSDLSRNKWAEYAYCHMSTLRRFLRGDRIRKEIFIALCEVIGLEDWRTVADFQSQEESSQPFAVFGRVPQGMNGRIDSLLQNLAKYAPEHEPTDNEGDFTLTGYFDPVDQQIILLLLKELASVLEDGVLSIPKDMASISD